MELSLARYWWVLLLRGIFALLFGALVIVWPMLALIWIVASFAVYALLDGAFAITAALTGGGGGHWWALLLEGVVGVTAGVLTLIWPEVTALALLWFIAAWAIATGVFEIVAAFRLRKVIEGEWLLALSGLLSVLFGIALFVFPTGGALALAWLIAAYALTFGVLMVALAFRLRALVRQTPVIVR